MISSQTALIILSASATLLMLSVEQTFRSTPTKELKRRARQGDDFAAALYKAAAYGRSLSIVLWFLIGVLAAAFFVLLSRATPVWIALGVSALIIWMTFSWMLTARTTRLGRFAARLASPFLSKILYYLHPGIGRLSGWVSKLLPVHFHTGLYDKEDLEELLESQARQTDNRIEQRELDMAIRALRFGDKKVQDFITPRRIVKMVEINDTTGPVLMDELHKSGYSRFPVYSENEDNIVGTLFLRDLIKAKDSGKVKSLMYSDVAYIHEEESLQAALQAILKTRKHLFIVVNSFEEFVGVITIEDVLEQIVGEPIVDEFDQYEDMRVVAAKQARAEHKLHAKGTNSDESEVIELNP